MAKLTGWTKNGKIFTRQQFNNSHLKSSEKGLTYKRYLIDSEIIKMQQNRSKKKVYKQIIKKPRKSNNMFNFRF